MTRRILILDDNAANRKLLVFALRTGDYEIYQAENSTEANALLSKEEQFDIALLDVELPDGNGLEIAEKMRQDTPATILIMLSALDSTEELNRACAIGADAYIVKPFNLAAVLKLINNIKKREPTEDNMVLLPNHGDQTQYRPK